MPAPKFGPVYTRIHEQVSAREFADTSQRLGFSSIWATESVWLTESTVTREPALECLTTVGALADHTTNLTVGSCVILLPLRNPVLLAREVAALDWLSGGRIVLGVGVGFEELHQTFEACGVSLTERAARCDESLEIMTKLWTGKPTTHDGRFYSFQELVMRPEPLQKPHPPIWIGGEAEGVLKRTARYVDGFVPVHVTPDEYRKAMEKINGYAQQFGRDVSSLTKALHLYVHIGDNVEESQRHGSQAISQRYGWPADMVAEKGCALGAPEDCIRTIERFISAGVEHFVINPATTQGKFMGQLERFAAEVMPHFRN